MLLLLIVIINYFDFLDITVWGTGGGGGKTVKINRLY